MAFGRIVNLPAIALLAAAAVIALPSASAHANLLQNGNFDDKYSNGIAKGWADNSGWADLKATYSRERRGAANGWAQRIDCDWLRSGVLQFVQSPLAVRKGRRYAVSLDLKGNLDAPVEILLRRRGSPYTTYAFKSVVTTPEWAQYQFVLISPVDDSRAMFMIRFASRGNLSVDNVVVSDATDWPNTIAPAAGNLVANGSFEVGLDRWAVETRERDGYEYEMPIRFADPVPTIERLHAPEGRRALRVTIPPHGQSTITSPFARMSPGARYTLSFWSRSDRLRTLGAGILGGSFGQSAGHVESVVLRPDWQRYTIAVTPPPAPQDAYHLIFEAVGPGDVWLDGVQLAAGQDDTFESRAPVEIGMATPKGSHLFHLGQKIPITAQIASHAANQSVEIVVASTDYAGQRRELGRARVTLDRHDLRQISFVHPSTEPGYFRIEALARIGDKTVDVSETAIGIVRDAPQPSLTSPFGNHARFSPSSLAAARDLGVSWLRMHPPMGTKWPVVEAQKGEFKFPDEPINYAKSLGFHILGSLEGTPRWAADAAAAVGGEESARYTHYPPANLADWRRYVFETVSHFRGTIDHWEVWNEPNSGGFLKIPGPLSEMRRPDVYVELLKAAYIAAKRANPDAVIVAGCATGHAPSEWFEKIFRRGAFDFMDVASFHHYTDGRPGDALDSPTRVEIESLRSLMRRYGKGKLKPIWETESGLQYAATGFSNAMQPVPGIATPAEKAVAYLVRNYVHLLSSGVERWFYYSMLGNERIDRSDFTGFFEWDGSPRPLAIAYANLAWVLGSAQFTRAVMTDADIEGAEFRDGTRTVLVLWKRAWGEGAKSSTSIPTPDTYRTVTVYDAMGTTLRTQRNSGTLGLALDTTPVYVVLSDPLSVR